MGEMNEDVAITDKSSHSVEGNVILDKADGSPVDNGRQRSASSGLLSPVSQFNHRSRFEAAMLNARSSSAESSNSDKKRKRANIGSREGRHSDSVDSGAKRISNTSTSTMAYQSSVLDHWLEEILFGHMPKPHPMSRLPSGFWKKENCRLEALKYTHQELNSRRIV
jgi:hypothetical protein